MAGPDGRPAARPISHRPAPVRRLRAGHRRRVLPAPAKTSHPAAVNTGPLPIAGALPPHPRPSLKDGQPGQAIFPAGQHSPPQNPREPQGLAPLGPAGRPLRPPENPRQPSRVPDREDGPPAPVRHPPGWSHATGEPGARLTAAKPSRNHQLQPTAEPGPARSHATGETPVPCSWRTTDLRGTRRYKCFGK